MPLQDCQRKPGMARGKAPLGREVIHILVGPSKQDFAIHKSLICYYSSYFKAAFTSFEEAKTGIMLLPETAVLVFELFNEWIYFQAVWNRDDKQETWSHLATLIKLYTFADMVNIPSLSYHTMKAIWSISKKTNAIPPNSFTYIWQHTPEESSLRKFLVDRVVWVADEAFLDKLTDQCMKSEYGGDILLEVMKDMEKQLQRHKESPKSPQISPLNEVSNYYISEKPKTRSALINGIMNSAN